MASIGSVLVLPSLMVLAISSHSLVQVNSGVQVHRGHSVSITVSDLKIQVDPSSSCKVEVVVNEPVTQRVGKLTPQVRVVPPGQLTGTRFTSSDTQVEMVVLRVQVLDGGPNVVELGSTLLVVPQFFGLSNTINSTVLRIKTPGDLVCTVRLMTAETKVPMVGRLVHEEESILRTGRQVQEFCPGNKPCLHHATEVQFLKTSCQHFLSSSLKYQHLSPPSPHTDYIPIQVELREQTTRKLLESQALWLPVVIHGAVQNQPPKADFMASSILEVDQFILTPLSTATLDATDPETPQDRLVFNVTAPPAEGYITHLEDHTKLIRSFTWLDLHDMKVAYQPPNSSQSLRQNLQVEFQVIDGSFTSSQPILVYLSIRASETDAPRVSWNMGLELLEGQSRPITWKELQVVDKDNIDAVYLVAVDGPVHGWLSVRGQNFTQRGTQIAWRPNVYGLIFHQPTHLEESRCSKDPSEPFLLIRVDNSNKPGVQSCLEHRLGTVTSGPIQRLQPNGRLPVSHTLFLQPVSAVMGLLPNTTFGPNYRVVSISWMASWFPSVLSLMRFGLATVRLSICRLTLAFCLPGTARQEVPVLGKDAMAQRCSRLAVPSGTDTDRIFLSDSGRRGAHVLETVIESKCEGLTGSGPPTAAHVGWMVCLWQMDSKTLPSCRTNKFFMFSTAGDEEMTQTGCHCSRTSVKTELHCLKLLKLRKTILT
ncbi:hypothetical protein GOODEAATRI_022415 [Goodea atripinnis]|uniref:FRAS1-related extracellular matrix protein N-terminal domain-containing protein n=1 Tax=Goodea atripinnis TaxID=208336 RepID=A0ABV0Q080_9TELE